MQILFIPPYASALAAPHRGEVSAAWARRVRSDARAWAPKCRSDVWASLSAA